MASQQLQTLQDDEVSDPESIAIEEDYESNPNRNSICKPSLHKEKVLYDSKLISMIPDSEPLKFNDYSLEPDYKLGYFTVNLILFLVGDRTKILKAHQSL